MVHLMISAVTFSDSKRKRDSAGSIKTDLTPTKAGQEARAESLKKRLRRGQDAQTSTGSPVKPKSRTRNQAKADQAESETVEADSVSEEDFVPSLQHVIAPSEDPKAGKS